MNADSIQLITNNYDKLTQNERIVADYILTHFNSAIQMSVHEIAQKTKVSVATPVRLAQHIGFDGYKDFRIYLASHQPEHEELILDIKQASNSVVESVEKALLSEIDSINLTLKELDYSKFIDAADKMKSANQILFFGLGTSQLVCRDAMYKFQRAGKIVCCADDISVSAALLSRFSKNDIVIGISHSGKTKNTCDILKLAKELGVYSVAITTFPGSDICRHADNIIYTQTRESPLHKIALTSRISQLATMDALFMTYFTMDYENCKNNIDKVSSNLQMIWEK